MIHLLFARTHDDEVKVIAMGDPAANEAFKKIANAGRENAYYGEIALMELNLYDARKRSQFVKPLSAEQRKELDAKNEAARNVRLLDEAREIQRNNEFVDKQLEGMKGRKRELTDDHKAALAEAARKTAPATTSEEPGFLDNFKIAELQQLADEEGIDLTGEDRKAEIIARIRVFRDLSENHTVDQLKSIAETEQVDLTGLTRKNDIVNAIAAERRAKTVS
jgi:hypothetical protein